MEMAGDSMSVNGLRSSLSELLSSASGTLLSFQPVNVTNFMCAVAVSNDQHEAVCSDMRSYRSDGG